MPILNFSPEFASKVASGEKLQTIRHTKKITIKVGDNLLLTDNKHHVITDVICQEVYEFEISEQPDTLQVTFWMNGYGLTTIQATAIAHNDGFESLESMITWFRNHYDIGSKNFKGQLIKW